MLPRYTSTNIPILKNNWKSERPLIPHLPEAPARNWILYTEIRRIMNRNMYDTRCTGLFRKEKNQKTNYKNQKEIQKPIIYCNDLDLVFLNFWNLYLATYSPPVGGPGFRTSDALRLTRH